LVGYLEVQARLGGADVLAEAFDQGAALLLDREVTPQHDGQREKRRNDNQNSDDDVHGLFLS
jgi:hypothetical protein